MGEYGTDHDFFELRETPAKRPIFDSFDTEENAYAYDGLGRFPSHTVDVAPAVSYGYVLNGIVTFTGFPQHCRDESIQTPVSVPPVPPRHHPARRLAVPQILA